VELAEKFAGFSRKVIDPKDLQAFENIPDAVTQPIGFLQLLGEGLLGVLAEHPIGLASWVTALDREGEDVAAERLRFDRQQLLDLLSTQAKKKKGQGLAALLNLLRAVGLASRLPGKSNEFEMNPSSP